MKKYIHMQMILISIILISPCMLLAQTAPGFSDNVTDTAPIDGGLSLLVAAGIGYGIKRLRKINKRNNVNKEEQGTSITFNDNF